MRAVIKESILAVLDEIIRSVEDCNPDRLSRLSNYTIHNSSIFQDPDSLSLAIITYALSKIISREMAANKDDTIIKSFSINLRKMKEYLTKDDFKNYRKKIGNIFKSIDTVDKQMHIYTQEVILKAKIKKGTVMFEHGISLARVAEALGITEWDLMAYIGQTNSIDKENPTRDLIKRLEFAKELFSV